MNKRLNIKILDIKINDETFSIYSYNQFHFHKQIPQSSHIHDHSYSEIFVFFDGNVTMNISNVEHSLSRGNILIIPPKTFHSTTTIDENAYYFSFQANLAVDDYVISSINDTTLNSFLNQCNILTENDCKNPNTLELTSCFLHIFSKFHQVPQPAFKSVSDYSMIIHEFFSLNYREDITLSDLAKELGLSEKQTNRIIKKYTNKTFLENLTAHRMLMADHLTQNTNMSKTEIAEYIGYQSYNGYWKARKNYTKL